MYCDIDWFSALNALILEPAVEESYPTVDTMPKRYSVGKAVCIRRIQGAVNAL